MASWEFLQLIIIQGEDYLIPGGKISILIFGYWVAKVTILMG